MSKCISFITGLITGVYITQMYNIPKVTSMVQTVVTKISEYERKEK